MPRQKQELKLWDLSFINSVLRRYSRFARWQLNSKDEKTRETARQFIEALHSVHEIARIEYGLKELAKEKGKSFYDKWSGAAESMILTDGWLGYALRKTSEEGKIPVSLLGHLRKVNEAAKQVVENIKKDNESFMKKYLFRKKPMPFKRLKKRR